MSPAVLSISRKDVLIELAEAICSRHVGFLQIEPVGCKVSVLIALLGEPEIDIRSLPNGTQRSVKRDIETADGDEPMSDVNFRSGLRAGGSERPPIRETLDLAL